jgi:hypothetical protein
MDEQCLEEVRPKIITYIKNIFKTENPSLVSEAYDFNVEGDGPFHITIKNKNDAEESVTLQLKPFEFKCNADGIVYIIEFGTPTQTQEGGKRRRKTYKRARRSSRQTRRRNASR